MTSLNGGYVMIDLTDGVLGYATAKQAVKAGKPVMVYKGAGIPEYVKGIKAVGDYVAIETANGVITIKKDGTVAADVTDITKLSSAYCEALKAGDVVVKTTTNQKHAYLVSYKEDGVGLCLTYTDATTVETVSYDCSEGVWTYNSTDKTTLTPDA